MEQNEPIFPVNNASTLDQPSGQDHAEQPAPSVQEQIEQSVQNTSSQPADPVAASAVPVKKKKTGLIVGLIAAVILIVVAFAAAFCIWYFVIRIPPVESITLSENHLSMFLKEQKQISYVILPEKANQKEVKLISSDDRVATVNANGTITAVGSGLCSITASADDQTAIVQVEVLKVNEEEYLVLGKWPGKGASLNDKVTVLTDPLYLNNDLSGSFKLGDDTYDFTWKYDKTDEDGDIWYDVYLTGASKVLTLVYNPSDNTLLFVIDVSSGMAILYDRS